MIIQVCGITRPEQIPVYDAMMIHQIGLDFSFDSSTNMVNSIFPEHVELPDSDLEFVGVFCNQPVEYMLSNAEAFRFASIQLTGSESPDVCRQLQSQYTLIKTISIDGQRQEDVLEMIEMYDDVCDYFLFDLELRPTALSTPAVFPWNILLDISVEKPFMIGGKGLRASDAPHLHQFRHPDYYGVSIHTQFEHASAAGDTALIFSFIKAIQQVIN